MGKVGSFVKNHAGVIGSVIGSVVPGVGTAIGGAIGGLVQGAGKAKPGAAAAGTGAATGGQGGIPGAVGLGKYTAGQAPVDETKFQPSQQSKDFYTGLNDRLQNANGAAPQVTAAQTAPIERATANTAAGPTQWNAAQLDPKTLGLSNGATSAAPAGNSEFAGVNMNDLAGHGAQGAGASAGHADAATIDKTDSNEIRAKQVAFADKLAAEEGGIASDALTRSLRQSTDRGLAAQMAMANSARGNAGLNQRNAANNMARVSQQGAQTGLDAFANERAAARGALSSNLQATRGVDAQLATDQAGFQNAASIANAGNDTQASIATANNMTNAGISNADAFSRALMQNSSLATQNNQFNTGQANDMSKFNAGQTNSFNMNRDDLLSRVGLSNTDAQNQAQNQFQNLNQNNLQFNAGQQNNMSQFNAGQQNNNNQFNTNLQQQGNLANQSAQLQQTGLNQQQQQFLLGLQNNSNQFDASQGMSGQQLLSNNFNNAQNINAQQYTNQQQNKGNFLSKLASGVGSIAGGLVKKKLGVG